MGDRARHLAATAAWIAAVAFGLAPRAAHADVTHVVARGHTLEAIAHRYHVSVEAIAQANHIMDAHHLRVGQPLTIPGVKATAPHVLPPPTRAAAHEGAPPLPPAPKKKPIVYAMRARTPGIVHATRLATGEDFTIRVHDRRGRASPAAARAFERMLRSIGNQTHAIDARLVALVGAVSDHFGSRKIEVISGFRPHTPTQRTAHSSHNVGAAMDFHVVGVPNEVVRDYCRSLRNVGVGYYPKSTFVHLDVRARSTAWTDYSRAGEPPRYDRPNPDADEGTSDVGEEIKPAAAPPAEPPAGNEEPRDPSGGAAPPAEGVPADPTEDRGGPGRPGPG